ncbi:hypothetical protein CMV_024255 [Castanea mollissima]|uniref:Uncharacterized protein n=1 Tax=Castanea mollissima TaxID=60419 RepID=A0A8J4V9U9_9ROSI|nr:hypothetical protein CMV_024255 [Castanea mollissima]
MTFKTRLENLPWEYWVRTKAWRAEFRWLYSSEFPGNFPHHFTSHVSQNEGHFQVVSAFQKIYISKGFNGHGS